jgi:hypothetical protein
MRREERGVRKSLPLKYWHEKKGEGPMEVVGRERERRSVLRI